MVFRMKPEPSTRAMIKVKWRVSCWFSPGNSGFSGSFLCFNWALTQDLYAVTSPDAGQSEWSVKSKRKKTKTTHLPHIWIFPRNSIFNTCMFTSLLYQDAEGYVNHWFLNQQASISTLTTSIIWSSPSFP